MDDVISPAGDACLYVLPHATPFLREPEPLLKLVVWLCVCKRCKVLISWLGGLGNEQRGEKIQD